MSPMWQNCLVARDRRAVAALEFALLAPLLIIIVMSFFETVRMIRAKSLFITATSNMATVIAAQPSIPPMTKSDLADYCNILGLTMRNYSTSSLAIAALSMTKGSGTSTTLDWEYDKPCATTAPSVGSAAAKTATSALLPNQGDSVIMLKATYTYKSILNFAIPDQTWTVSVFARPRITTVPCSDCSSNGT